MKKRATRILACMICILGWSYPAFTEQPPAPRGELRIVDKNPLNWAWVTLNIFEHLVEVDKDGLLVPRLATGWHWANDHTLIMSLRHGITFHNGEVFDAEIVRLNWEDYTRLRMPTLLGEVANFKPGSRLEIVDPQTVRFIFPEPDGGALLKLAQVHMANRQFHQELGWGEKGW